ncbi:hypothetical protein Hypma_014488 [Hypsizygus marmoreus]|uniref:Transmembrane protein n=1 Tax=Hypsizygus marmoreus TaxID=39966 RepID=A0A369JC15_HYPMA|nr:hypothetical protein Hypma_014488 [Hypsizygus marmoreus]
MKHWASDSRPSVNASIRSEVVIMAAVAVDPAIQATSHALLLFFGVKSRLLTGNHLHDTAPAFFISFSVYSITIRTKMPDWKAPAELLKDARVFTKFMHVLMGLYIYEWLISLPFDWDFISGKKRFRWPMIFYFSGRYLLLFAMIGIAIALDTTTKINCQVLYLFNQLAGNAAVGLASINLSIRTIAVWSQNKYIIGLLILVILGHWSLILQGVLLSATWVEGVGCVIISTNNRVLAATFIYSMLFDLLILVLNTHKLLNLTSKRRFGMSTVARIISRDGLTFFIIAFLANLVATVFMVLDLNQIMSVIFNVPSAVVSTIVASRAVRRLTTFQNVGAEVYGDTTSNSDNANFRHGLNVGPRATALGSSKAEASKCGVHVQMETFTHVADIQVRDMQEHQDASETDIDLEAKGHPL